MVVVAEDSVGPTGRIKEAATVLTLAVEAAVKGVICAHMGLKLVDCPSVGRVNGRGKRTRRRDEQQSRPVFAQKHWRELVENVLLKMFNDFKSDDGFACAEVSVILREGVYERGGGRRVIRNSPQEFYTSA